MLTAPLIAHQSSQILCYYTNQTDQTQTVKVCDLPSGSFERLVLPKQSILFQSQPNLQLEIYSSTDNAPALEKVSCDSLRASKEVLSHLLLRVR
ncbi:MAG: DUF1830 domain-containing protein [Kovacikia sp.]